MKYPPNRPSDRLSDATDVPDGAPAVQGRVAHILSVAAQLFSEHGFEGVSFRDLTAATGAKRSLLLYHFASKEELWQAAMRHIMERFNAVVLYSDLPAEDADDRSKVVGYLKVYINALVAVPQYGRVLIREGVREGPRLDWLVRHFVPAFAFEHRLQDESRVARISSSMLRDLVIGAPLVATALGPLIEASTAAASGVSAAGINPLSEARRDELVLMIARLVMDE